MKGGCASLVPARAGARWGRRPRLTSRVAGRSRRCAGHRDAATWRPGTKSARHAASHGAPPAATGGAHRRRAADPSPPRQRPDRSRDRTRALSLPEHRADPRALDPPQTPRHLRAHAVTARVSSRRSHLTLRTDDLPRPGPITTRGHPAPDPSTRAPPPHQSGPATAGELEPSPTDWTSAPPIMGPPRVHQRRHRCGCARRLLAAGLEAP